MQINYYYINNLLQNFREILYMIIYITVKESIYVIPQESNKLLHTFEQKKNTKESDSNILHSKI